MTKIIEASAIISAKAGDMSGFAAISKNLSAVSKASDAVKKSMGGVSTDLVKRIADIGAKLRSIDNFKSMSRGLDQASIAMRQAQQNAARLKTALDAAGDTASRKLMQDYSRASTAVERATRAFREQGQAVRAARGALTEAGIPVNTIAQQQAALTRSLNATTRAMERQAMAGRAMRGAAGIPASAVPSSGYRIRPGAAAAEGTGATIIPFGIKGAGVLAAGYAVARAHGAVLDQHNDFQQAYLYQQAVLGVDKEGQRPLLDQAEKIGKDTKFTNADIVKAQTDIGSKLPKQMQTPGVIMGITEHTKNYALAMQVSMEEASEAIVGYMKSWGYDLSSPQAAEASARRASNYLVEFAKTTGAKHHDLIGMTKFGAAPSRVGGMSEELTNAIAAQLVRVGYEGAMAGTFSRAVATKLAVPTQQGRVAMASAGIEYGDYRRPGSVPATAESFALALKQKYGRGLTPAQQAAFQAIIDDPDVMNNSGAFAEKTSEFLNSNFARRTKSGKIDVKQAESLRKTLDQWYAVVSGGVDTPRLFMDLLNRPSGLSPALARYLFGQEHGGRAIGLDVNAIRRDEATYKATPENRAQVVGDKMQEGAQGEWNKLVGSVQTFGVALGEATDATRAWTYKGLGSLFDYLTDAVSGKNKNPEVGKNMIVTPEGAKYRLDTWNTDAIGIYERSRRAQIERIRDPEAARGRAMLDISRRGDLELAQPKEVVAKVEGAATISGVITVSPSPEFLARIDQRIEAKGNLTTGNGPGSTGRSMPEASAPNVGSGNPMGPR